MAPEVLEHRRRVFDIGRAHRFLLILAYSFCIQKSMRE